jgi:hypothetical protein
VRDRMFPLKERPAWHDRRSRESVQAGDDLRRDFLCRCPRLSAGGPVMVRSPAWASVVRGSDGSCGRISSRPADIRSSIQRLTGNGGEHDGQGALRSTGAGGSRSGGRACRAWTLGPARAAREYDVGQRRWRGYDPALRHRLLPQAPRGELADRDRDVHPGPGGEPARVLDGLPPTARPRPCAAGAQPGQARPSLHNKEAA